MVAALAALAELDEEVGEEVMEVSDSEVGKSDGQHAGHDLRRRPCWAKTCRQGPAPSR